MFEAQVAQGALWKKLIEAIKDLVNEANFDCSPGGLSIQAMDQSHVALVNLLLKKDGFAMYNCERNTILGLNLQSLAKILKTTDNNDTITLRHEDDSDILTMVCDASDGAKTSEFQLKLMEIETESMGIPEMEYRALVSLPSAEFAKICRDMNIFGDTVTVEISREGVKFSATGDIGDGFALLKSSTNVDERRVKAEVKHEKKVKNEVKPEKVKKEDDDDDVPIASKLDRSAIANATGDGVFIQMDEPVTLSFALRYLNTFAKGASLSDRVNLHLARDSPCMIEYKIEGLGFLRYYLAPKIDETEAS